MTIVVRTKVVGVKAVRDRLQQLERAYPAAFRVALYREALRIFAVSQTRVPVDTGRLRASGGVTQPTASSPLVIIYYGVVYAGIVHEKHPTKSKFLEGPFLEARTGMVQRIEGDIVRLAGRPGQSLVVPRLPSPPKLQPG